MSLKKYSEKRDFTRTEEPKAKKSKSQQKLIFVVQKHAASHLHYDFRLEMDGVLKSWAVPKGPSTDPSVKRLAMMVEDHPYDYRNFEGIIPKGEYGGGTVIVWDEGYYEPLGIELGSKKEQEKQLIEQLKNGSIKIRLHGEKLNGEFALVRTKGMAENSWLLIKHKDDFASKEDITKNEKSVQSGKTLEEVEKTSNHIYGEDSKKKSKEKEDKKKDKAEGMPKEPPLGPKRAGFKLADPNKDVASLLKGIKKTKIPLGIKPMLATLVDKAFEAVDWFYEVKWDGYRALAFIEKGDVRLLSRNNKPFNDKYYPITQLLSNLKIDAVLDGEIVVLNDDGISDFSSLQNWRSEVDGELVFFVFDLLWYEGKSLMEMPFLDRYAVLKQILPTNDDRLRLSEVFDTNGIDFLEAARKLGLEGIMAKKGSSIYIPDNRSKEWLKIKASKRQEVVIGGFTKNENTSKEFSALLLGVFDNGRFKYAGKVGTGFSDKVQREMMKQFEPLIITSSPFEVEPNVNQPSRFRPNPPNAKATWLKPTLVCEIAFSEITKDGVFRHPSFKGMRVDKDANDVIRETEISADNIIQEKEKPKRKEKIDSKGAKTTKSPQEKDGLNDSLVKAPKSDSVKTLLNPKEETQVKKLCGHELKFTNLSKVYWPEDGFTKRDMFNYYYQVAEYILPYLKDRPQSLNRFPNGIHGSSFYQKDVKGKAPEWVKTFPYTTSEGEKKEYLVGNDEATLLWMASLGCIEMNPWFSRIQSPDNPDYCIIDLDPDKNTFDQVIQAARAIKEMLDEVDVPCYCKTSGSTGMHIYIPLEAKVSYDQSQLFAKLIVNVIHDQLPEFTSLERMVKKRKGKMYLDFLQNRPGATVACPYSLRPKIGATVSMPLVWDEVKPGLKMKDFTIKNAIDRVRSEGDPFKDVLEKGIDLEKTLEKFHSVFNS